MMVLFAHLMGTCLALGMIALTDARLVAKVVGYKLVMPPPSRFERRIVKLALLLQLVSGAALVGFGMAEQPGYLDNAALHTKALLFVLIAFNAFVLHHLVFPNLERATPAARWTPLQRKFIAATLALSNALWLVCAFLGVAQGNLAGSSLAELLLVAAALWLVLTLVARCVIALGLDDRRRDDPDGLDSFRQAPSAMSGLGDLGAYSHQFRDDPSMAPTRPLLYADAVAPTRTLRNLQRRANA